MPLGEASGEELEMTGEARTHTQTMMTAQQGAGAERELKFVADPKTFKVALARVDEKDLNSAITQLRIAGDAV